MVDKSLDHLHPDLRPLCQEWLVNTTMAKLKAIITETWRDPAREDALHAQGITHATESNCKHCFELNGNPASKAFDFLLIDEENRIISDGTDDRYTLAGQIAKDLGMTWGGDFTHPDYDHVEIA